MYDLLDLLLLKRGTPIDDRTLAFHRIDGPSTAQVIYFLPWHTPFKFAWQAGLLPLDFLACYEMPPAIVSSQPDLCASAMRLLVADAERRLREAGVREEHALVVGLSVGTYPATYLANRIGARLCSVASADRADLAVWQSPATRIIRSRAIQKGLRLADYSTALNGTHPAQNLRGIAKNSLFVMGQRDPFVPQPRSAGLLQAIEAHAPAAQVVRLNAGHFKTLVSSGRYQRAMLGIERPKWRRNAREYLQARMSARISLPVSPPPPPGPAAPAGGSARLAAPDSIEAGP
jgi:pimeloyl-ACP methyl ester carboxylesterase